MSELPPPFDVLGFRVFLGCLVGAVLGSFGTVLAHRLPRGESIVWPRSRCPSCRTVLGIADLVPIVSWLAAKGRCRHCGAAIGGRYLLIEGVCAILGGLIAILLT